jgi:hypothetical protein
MPSGRIGVNGWRQFEANEYPAKISACFPLALRRRWVFTALNRNQ